MPDSEKKGETKINIELSQEMAEGIYCNLAVITHSQSEFIADFIKIMPGVPKARVKSRIILTPQHAKRLMNALADNIKKYEDKNGPISDKGPINIPMNFGGPTAEA